MSFGGRESSSDDMASNVMKSDGFSVFQGEKRKTTKRRIEALVEIDARG